MVDPLTDFSLPVRRWFHRSFGAPTAPQARGWPAIKAGESVLILAPTGSGKTLAAFLAGVDAIYRELAEEQGRPNPGVRLLYVSPLKALNNDIERNLRGPLAGIRAEAADAGESLPPLAVAVRTGDTPGSARQAMVKNPPHILITTPESLYLIATSPKAREILRTVRSVIVDEIHTLVGDKRGAHLMLSLERLEELAGRSIQRIGLSATIRPLDEAARFLGGQDEEGQPRPITVVDTGYKKPLDLQVVLPVADFRDMPGDSIWPSVIPQVLGDIMRHRTTLIFANNRRLAERTADRLNAQIAAERSEEIAPGSTEALAPGGVMRDKGLFAIGAEGPIKAHHGSTSKEARRELEEQLKAGRLPALVSTGTLELGIDIGHVDLVVQLQSPKSVNQALQRVGRSGHLVGQTSRGRIYATHREDLVEAAAVVQGMLEGAVEPTKAPENPLDVLAQQVVAAVSVEPWDEKRLYAVVRRAYPYRALSRSAWESVLAMLSGRYQAYGGPGHASLRARILWERETGRLAPLPGSRLLALSNPGTIPDTGAFNVVLSDGKTSIGTLDEEFVFETRTGDVFMLGSNTWRVLNIDHDKIVVGDAAGYLPRMPFWRGDYPWRSYELGVRIGRLRRDVAQRIAASAGDEESLLQEIRREYALDANSARALVDYVSRQVDALGAISSDDTIIVEGFADAVGEARLVVHSPFGGRVNGAWALTLVDAMRERTGMEVESQVNDDGILLRFPGALLGADDIGMTGPGVPQEAAQTGLNVDLAARVVSEMSVHEARQRILRELPNSAVFGARFRMNAGRALLLPKVRGGKRTPFWLQRMKARDLLATVRQIGDFPLIAETYRDCLRDIMDVAHLDELLRGIEAGRVQVLAVQTRAPSPLAAELMYAFAQTYVYEWDAPKAEQQLQALSMRRDLVDDLLDGVESGRLPLKIDVPGEEPEGAAHTAAGRKARNADELSVVLLEAGDLTEEEIAARSAGDWREWLAELVQRGNVVELNPAWAGEATTAGATGGVRRWVSAEFKADYDGPAGVQSILRRYLRWCGPVTHRQLVARYPLFEEALNHALSGLVSSREIVQGHFSGARDAAELEYLDRQLFEQLYRRTLAALRREVQPVPLATYQQFVLGWQHASAATRRGEAAVAGAMEQLRGLALPAQAWEREVLPARVAGYRPGAVEALLRSGEFAWVAATGDVRYVRRREGALFLGGTPVAPMGSATATVLEYLKSEGASFFADIQAGTGLTTGALRDALRELAASAVLHGEGHAALSAIQQAKAAPAGRKAASALEEELAARLPERPLGRTRATGRTSRDRYRELRRQGGQPPGETNEESAWEGRWAVVQRAAIMGAARSREERGGELARLALGRYGVVTPEIVHRAESRWVWDEAMTPAQARWEWSEIYEQLLRMELRGEVRRGYFVRGLSGVQFALPAAVESLREQRDLADDAVTVLSALDPANLHGGETLSWDADDAGEPEARLRFARVASTHVVLWRGQTVLVGEDSGFRLQTGAAEPQVLREALRAYLYRPAGPRRIAISTWNGESVLGSQGEGLLRELGASRSPTGLDWWRD